MKKFDMKQIMRQVNEYKKSNDPDKDKLIRDLLFKNVTKKNSSQLPEELQLYFLSYFPDLRKNIKRQETLNKMLE